jgi:ATPase subunit of ABC transporter with duplicated ATPase domains
MLVAHYRAKEHFSAIRISPTVSCGYFDQELSELDVNQEVFGLLRRETEFPDQDLITALVRAGFPYARHKVKVAVLSGGEKARLCMLRMKLEAPSLLILDEPTNHLDVQGIEQLEEDLTSASATCIFVSHDRRFVRRVANRIVTIEKGLMRE